MSLESYREQDENQMGYGGLGFDELSGTDTQPAGRRYFCLIALEAAQLGFTNQKDGQTFSSFALPLGIPIFGDFDGLAMESGRILAYKRDA